MPYFVRMALVRQVVALGHSARNSRNIKLRQPLARALVYRQSGGGELDEELIGLVWDELNVKQVTFVDDVSDLVTYRLLPDNKVLGPRFGRLFPAVRAQLAALDPLAAVRRLRAGLPLQIEVEGEPVDLAPDEVLVQARDLVNGRSVVVDSQLREVTYIHMLLPKHQIVWANGVETESFHPASTALSTLDDGDRKRLLQHHPEFAMEPQSYGAAARRNLTTSEAAILLHEAA